MHEARPEQPSFPAMDRSRALARLNGRILAAYSRRTVVALPHGLPVRVLLGRLEPVLVLNVEKEMRKDAIVIARAGDAHGAAPRAELLRELVEATKAIDREFLERARSFPVRLNLRYEDIVPVRTRRIERLYGGARRILQAWSADQTLRGALRVSFPQAELEGLLRELLQLYAQEVRVLSRSVVLPALLTPLREHLARGLHAAMSDVAVALARELAQGLHHAAPNARGISSAS